MTTQAGFVGEQQCSFYLQFLPAAPPRGHVVYLPPFTEEMNRCRSLAVTQARHFARNGLSCSMLDYYGTGESPGDLDDASLDAWRQNIQALIQHLQRLQEAPITLWGCRLGALLALDHACRAPDSVHQLLLWQPVTSGSLYITQLLRQRAAALMQKGEKAESTKEMKQRFAAGENIEVGGYPLGGPLMAALDQLELSRLGDAGPRQVYWFEHSTDEPGTVNMAASRSIEQLRQKGSQVDVDTFAGDPVWQLHKRGECDELLRKTQALSL